MQLTFRCEQKQLELFVPSTWEVWEQGKDVVVKGPYTSWKTSWPALYTYTFNRSFTGEIPTPIKVGLTAFARKLA